MKAKIDVQVIKSLKPAAKPYDVWDTHLSGFLLRVQPTGSMSYFVTYRHGGPREIKRRTRISVGKSPHLTPTEARAQARLMLARIHQGADPQADRRKARTSTLRAFLSLRYRSWAAAHMKRGVANVERLEACFPELLDLPLEQITSWHVEKRRSQRKAAGIKASTINRDTCVLKAALNKAVEWQLIESSPLARVKPLKVDSRSIVRYLSDYEATRLMQALDARETRIRIARDSANQFRRERGYEELPSISLASFADYLKPAVILSRHTGLRRGELLQLRWESIRLEQRILTVDGDTAKSGQTRHISLNVEAIQALTTWWKGLGRPATGFVFASKDDKKRVEIKSAWKSVLKEAGIQRLRWHDLRHDFASRLVMSGADLNTVRELLGHADSNMVLRYAHLAPQVTAAAVSKLSAFRVLSDSEAQLG